MAEKEFDPMDIRSEIGFQNVETPDVETSARVTPEEMLQLVAIRENPSSLEKIVPGEVGNEIDVENPPDFVAMNQVFPIPPLVRRSKRQARYDPDFLEPKKIRTAPKNLLYTNFSSEDDSADQDFEIVVLPKPLLKKDESLKGTSSINTDRIKDDDEDLSLAEISASLKKRKRSKTHDTPDSPDAEMMKEFEQNQPDISDSSASDSKFSSESDEYTAGRNVLEQEDSEDVIIAGDQDVVQDAANIYDNTDMEDYDLSKSLSSKFYSENALVMWPFFSNRDMIEERSIDMEAYARQNLLQFLKDRSLLSTVTKIAP